MRSIDFKIGDLVKINPESEYYGRDPYNPINTPGVIVELTTRDLNPIDVMWSDTKQVNEYSQEDLDRIYYNDK